MFIKLPAINYNPNQTALTALNWLFWQVFTSKYKKIMVNGYTISPLSMPPPSFKCTDSPKYYTDLDKKKENWEFFLTSSQLELLCQWMFLWTLSYAIWKFYSMPSKSYKDFKTCHLKTMETLKYDIWKLHRFFKYAI